MALPLLLLMHLHLLPLLHLRLRLLPLSEVRRLWRTVLVRVHIPVASLARYVHAFVGANIGRYPPSCALLCLRESKVIKREREGEREGRGGT